MQLRHLVERGSHRYNRVLKSRQFGFTTLYCIDYLDEALWVPGMSCAILAHEQKYNEKIFSIVKRAYEGLPPELLPKTKTNTKYDYSFSHRFDGDPLDSSIYVATDVRSGTVQKLHITEAAWLKDPAKIKAGAKQAVPKNGSITEETTANGFNDFHDDYDASQEIEDKGQLTEYDYKTHFYAWWENPDYSLPGTMPEILPEDQLIFGDEVEIKKMYKLTDGQLLWRRWKIRELRQNKGADGVTLNGLQLFKQEYPGNRQEAFQSGAGNVFDVSNAKATKPFTLAEGLAQIENQEQKTKFKALYRLGVKFWVIPEPKKSYIIGVDPSGGGGGDFGCIDIWDKDSLVQVAQLHGQFRPDILATHSADIGYFYNTAYVGIENNMLTCILSLVSLKYPKYFFETKIDQRTFKKTKKVGWNTNTKTRDPMIDDYIIAWEDGLLKVNSAITLSEMKTFTVKENGKREHANGKQDDALISGMIALQMRKLEPKRARSMSGSGLY